MRETINEALKTAIKSADKPRISTLRMIRAAIQERDIANRGVSKDAASSDEIMQIMAKMVKQREESAKAYDDGNRPELAEQERGEIAILRGYMPTQMDEGEMTKASQDMIAELGAAGLRDMGRVMNALKERYAGQMDFGKASGVIKGLLQ